MTLDLAVQPHDLEAIEVYGTASVPARYGSAACGVVLVWTRVPERVHGRGSWWKGLAVLGSLLGVIMLAR